MVISTALFLFSSRLLQERREASGGGNGGTDERGEGNSLWFSFLVASSASSQNWKSGQRKEGGDGLVVQWWEGGETPWTVSMVR